MIGFGVPGVICFVTAQHDFTLVVQNTAVKLSVSDFLYH